MSTNSENIYLKISHFDTLVFSYRTCLERLFSQSFSPMCTENIYNGLNEEDVLQSVDVEDHASNESVGEDDQLIKKLREKRLMM